MQTEFQTQTLTVTQVSQSIGSALQAGFPQWIWLEGEISGFKVWGRPAKGWFFELKDARSTLPAVVWASDMPNIVQPRDGEQVRVLAKVSWANKQGRLNLNVKQMQQAGLGALLIEIEARRNRLVSDGLTAIERKRPLPKFPSQIALVTSPDSAAAADVLRVLRLRWPMAQVRIYPSGVQGEQAPKQLIAALDAMDREGQSDLCLLVRGGGSLTDLMAFNDEDLCRRIPLTHCPVITGIGHETDTALVDWVSDLYASTPSNAAELASPDHQEVLAQLYQRRRQATQAIALRLAHQRQRLSSVDQRLTDPSGLFAKKREGLNRTQRELIARLRASIGACRLQLSQQQQRLVRQDPHIRLTSARSKQQALATRLNNNPMARHWWGQRSRLQQIEQRLHNAMRLSLQPTAQRLAHVRSSLRALDPRQVLSRGYAFVQDQHGQVVQTGGELSPDQTLFLRFQDHETLDVSARVTGLHPKG